MFSIWFGLYFFFIMLMFEAFENPSILGYTKLMILTFGLILWNMISHEKIIPTVL